MSIGNSLNCLRVDRASLANNSKSSNPFHICHCEMKCALVRPKSFLDIKSLIKKTLGKIEWKYTFKEKK